MDKLSDIQPSPKSAPRVIHHRKSSETGQLRWMGGAGTAHLRDDSYELVETPTYDNNDNRPRSRGPGDGRPRSRGPGDVRPTTPTPLAEIRVATPIREARVTMLDLGTGTPITPVQARERERSRERERERGPPTPSHERRASSRDRRAPSRERARDSRDYGTTTNRDSIMTTRGGTQVPPYVATTAGSTTQVPAERDRDYGTSHTNMSFPLPRTLEYSQSRATSPEVVNKLHKKFSNLSPQAIVDLINRFHRIPTDTPGRIHKSAAIAAVEATGEGTYDTAREILKSIKLDATGKVELDDWIELISKLRLQAADPSKAASGSKWSVKNLFSSSNHTLDNDERTSFTIHINSVLRDDPDVADRLPIPTNSLKLFDECRDGIILAKLLHHSVPGSIDLRQLHRPSRREKERNRESGISGGRGGVGSEVLNPFQITENNNLVLKAAKAVPGLFVVNIGADDIAEGREHLILGLIWQIIRKGLLNQVNIKLHPDLYKLCEKGERVEELLKLPPDEILLRWFNYHLKAADSKKRVHNFSDDIKDGEAYTILLHQLAPADCPLTPLQTKDLNKRAEEILYNAGRIGVRRYLNAHALVTGNPRLNLAFVANLFNIIPGLSPRVPGSLPPIRTSVVVPPPPRMSREISPSRRDDRFDKRDRERERAERERVREVERERERERDRERLEREKERERERERELARERRESRLSRQERDRELERQRQHDAERELRRRSSRRETMYYDVDDYTTVPRTVAKEHEHDYAAGHRRRSRSMDAYQQERRHRNNDDDFATLALLLLGVVLTGTLTGTILNSM